MISTIGIKDDPNASSITVLGHAMAPSQEKNEYKRDFPTEIARLELNQTGIFF
jgi:hypothetical protein